MAEGKNPELREIAQSTVGLDITRHFAGVLAKPQDAVLAAKGGGLEIYQEVLRDAQVYSCLQQRRLALVSREWEIIPGAEDRASRKAADFAREMIAGIGFDRITSMMHYGVFYGYAMAELIYARDGGQWTIDAVKVRKARRFRFGADGRPRLLTKDNRDGIEVPERKFWSYATGADNDDEPYGLGLGHVCYWPVWLKRNGVKFWAVFLEKFGAPTPVGRYGPGATEAEQAKLLQAVAAVQSDSGIILPEGMTIELLEAARGGTVDYGAFHDKMDAAIAKVILSQTMTTDNGSSLAQGQVHADVKAEVVKADADLICGSFNRGPLAWLTRWNFEGATPPKVWRVMTEPEDLNLRADRDLKIWQMGFVPDADYMLETYGPGWVARPVAATPTDDFTPTPDPSPQGGGRERNAAFAETGGDATDRLAGQLDLALAPMMDDLIGQVRAIIDASDDFAEVSEKLLRLRPELDARQMADVLRQALTVAQLDGRADMINGA
jgi:phage gp29-like protein